MIEINQPKDKKYRIELSAGTDGDDQAAILYEYINGERFRLDTMIFTEPVSGVVSKYPGMLGLFFIGNDDLEEDLPVSKEETVHHPAHYNSHPEGIEAYLLTKHENFLLGNVFKYLLRHGLKGEDILEDVNKALEYLQEYAKYVEQYGESALPHWRAEVRRNGKRKES